MSDFLSSFWSFYIALLTVGGILACAVLLKVMSSKRAPAGTKPELHGHVWDEDLAEYNNPLPRWWMWLFYITIVFSLAYLALYPGFGRAPGVLGWTFVGAYAQESRETEDKLKPVYARYMAMDLKAVAMNADAHA